LIGPADRPAFILPALLRAARDFLGGADGSDEDEAESERHKGAVVLGRLHTAERYTLEALQLAHKLLDAGASPGKTPLERKSVGSGLTP
jgi:hypothetical protein